MIKFLIFSFFKNSIYFFQKSKFYFSKKYFPKNYLTNISQKDMSKKT